jgi:hypothetical protein
MMYVLLYEECLRQSLADGVVDGLKAKTSICINDEIDPRKQLLIRNAPPRASSKWERIWDVSQLSRGTRFLVGAQGRLKTIEVIKGSRLLLEWDLIWRGRTARNGRTGASSRSPNKDVQGGPFYPYTVVPGVILVGLT